MPRMRLLILVGLALGIGGCVSTSRTEAPPAPAGPQPVSGWLAGPAGQGLEPEDRQRAFDAQIAAVDTGRRASWRSPRGHFGFVEPGPEGSGGGASCRSFNHTLYVDGRAQRGGGSACRSPDGAWRVTG